MLKVIVELHPHGSKDGIQEIETLYIANVGQTGYNEAKYDFWINQDPRELLKRPEPTGHVKNFDRNRGSLELVMECMKVATKKGKKK